ncbi:hypothetical protein BREVNS_0664 [Brevinematales bacterium NS]|nr:hypothetical protein BREVNS_0664 [Brevinematales bacterium NS]
MWGKATEDVAPDASCTLTSEGLPRFSSTKSSFHHRKSGQVDTERSRSGVQKKDKRTGPSLTSLQNFFFGRGFVDMAPRQGNGYDFVSAKNNGLAETG